MTRKVEVLVDGNSKGFSSAIDQASGKATGFGKIIQGVGLGIGAGMVGLAAGGISTLIGSLDEANTAFMEDKASADKLAVALKNNIPGWTGNTAAIEERIAAQQRLGFSDDEQRDSLATLTGVFKDVGLAMDVQTAAMDLARLKGIDLATASDILIKAEQGKMKGLQSVGIQLDKNASLQEILGAVTKVAGGQAEAYAAGPLGKQEAAQLKVGEAMEKLGGAVNRVSAVAIPLAAEAFTQIIAILEMVWKEIGPLVEELIKELGPAFQTIAKILTGTVIPIMVTVAKAILPPLIAVVKVVAAVFSTSFNNVSKVVGTAMGAVTRAINAVMPIIKAIGTAVTTVAGVIFGAVNRIVSFFAGLGGRISGAVAHMWDGIFKAFKSVINMVIRGWNSISFTLPKVDIPFVGTFGGFTIGTPNIPYLHSGGIVPGRRGDDVPAILQAGERVTPIGKSEEGGNTVIINIESFIGSDRDIDRFADKVAFRLRTVG